MSIVAADKGRDPDDQLEIESLISEVIADPDQWMDIPNDQLGGHKPKDLNRNRWRSPAERAGSRDQNWRVFMNLGACRALARRPIAGTWYRAIQLKFWSSLLATEHTKTIPGRFNAGDSTRPGFEILYFAEDHQVAMFEVQALLGSPIPGSTYRPNPSGHWALINVQIQLDRVVDLTRRSERVKVGTTVQELTGDWRGYLLRNPNPNLKKPYWTNVPTQKLGHALYAIRGVEGFLTYSARVPTRRNLVVFPSRLRPGNFIEFQDPIMGQTHRIS